MSCKKFLCPRWKRSFDFDVRQESIIFLSWLYSSPLSFLVSLVKFVSFVYLSKKGSSSFHCFFFVFLVSIGFIYAFLFIISLFLLIWGFVCCFYFFLLLYHVKSGCLLESIVMDWRRLEFLWTSPLELLAASHRLLQVAFFISVKVLLQCLLISSLSVGCSVACC